MAKRRTRSAAMTVYRPAAFPRPAAPVIRISAPRMVSSGGKKRKGHRRASRGESGGKDVLFKHAIGGAALGFAEKSGIMAKVPQLPMLGVKGSFAALGYFLGFTKKPGIMRDAVIAAATLAGYEMGKEGKISGDDD